MHVCTRVHMHKKNVISFSSLFPRCPAPTVLTPTLGLFWLLSRSIARLHSIHCVSQNSCAETKICVRSSEHQYPNKMAPGVKAASSSTSPSYPATTNRKFLHDRETWSSGDCRSPFSTPAHRQVLSQVGVAHTTGSADGTWGILCTRMT